MNWPSKIAAGVIWAIGRALCLIGLHRWEKCGRAQWRCGGCFKSDLSTTTS